MIQTSPHKWEIVTQGGVTLQRDINANTTYDATQYIKNYVSSFQGWTYELIPLIPDTI